MKFKDASKKTKKFLLKDKNYITIFAIVLCILFFLAGAIVSVLRHLQYETFYYDFGLFDMAIWKAAHFQIPAIDHLVIGGKIIFADHLNPSLFLYSPLFWLTDRSEILLVAQAATVAVSGGVLYFLARRVLKNNFYSLSILVCYLFFVGLQNAVITDFHEITLATLPFILCFWFLVNKNFKWYFVSLIVLLGFKESNFGIGIGIGIAAFLIDRKFWKVSLATIIVSSIWGYLALNHIIPYFSGGRYQYAIDIDKNPIVVASKMIDNETKVQTIFRTFQSFGFIPAISYQFWLLIFQDFLGRFYSPIWMTRWGIALHYSAIVASIMGVSSIYGFVILQKIIKKKIIITIIATLLILNSVFLYRFVLHGPFALAYNTSFYGQTKNLEFLNVLTSKVPKDASVMAQNNLATRFTHQKLWMLQSDQGVFSPDYYKQKKPEYIVIDAREGQNPNNYFLVKNMGDLLDQLENDKKYEAIYKTNDQYIYKRIK